jgi:DNA-directed RNA polymerase subunit E'/Rpb7
MKYYRILLFYLVLLSINQIFAQTTTISHLLQKTLQQENKARQMVHTEVDSVGDEIGLLQMAIDTLEVIELTIKNDTLVYTTKNYFTNVNGYYLYKQEVALKDITAVTKDIGIFFESAPEKVFVTQSEYFYDGNYKITTGELDLFRTHFTTLRENEYLADELVKAFKNAGYTIEKGYWYD